MTAYTNTSKAYTIRLLLSLLIALISLSDFSLQLEEDWGLSWLLHLRGPMVAPEDIVIVSIDKESVDTLNLNNTRGKWPRTVYAELIKKINPYDPVLIGFNILFSENRNPDDDLSLATAMREKRNIILTNYIKQVSPSFGDASAFLTYHRTIDPIPVLADEALAIAPFPLPKTASTVKRFWLDRGNRTDLPTFPIAVFQSYLLNKAYPEISSLLRRLYPQLALDFPSDYQQLLSENRALEIFQQIDNLLIQDPKALQKFEQLVIESNYDSTKSNLLKSWTALMASKDNLYFNYYGKTNTITTIPLYRVLSDEQLSPEMFTGKIILVGFSENIEPEKQRGFYTVFSGSDGDTFSSTEIAATAIANLLDQSWIKPLEIGPHLILIATWTFLLSVIKLVLNFRLILVAILSFSAFYIASAYLLFSVYYIWIPLVIPVFVLAPTILALPDFPW